MASVVAKKSRASKYTTSDTEFVYKPDSTYTREDFSKLSIIKLRLIGKQLFIRQVERQKREVLLDRILEKHAAKPDIVENEIDKKNNTGNKPLENIKKLMLALPHFILDKKVWYQGTHIASVLGYANPAKATYDHVRNKDKLKFEYLMKRTPIQNGSHKQEGMQLIADKKKLSQTIILTLFLSTTMQSLIWCCNQNYQLQKTFAIGSIKMSS